MSMNDPISDMLTRIRNGLSTGKPTVLVPASKIKVSMLTVLTDEGYIRGQKAVKGEDGHDYIQVELKYDEGQPAIRELHRVSKPGRRVFRGVKTMPKFYNGLGVSIVTTPKGVMTDYQAREQNVGGEVLCQVY
ncbi:MAG: 30S ribosomal protein S8 [Pseudomonadota bacterium]|nr:30S ribosomal protein S8 [Alphaproteobacteria bacterium]MEE3323079.1 30S ribosomal protein S8 [Pseudomonadota bacterium]